MGVHLEGRQAEAFPSDLETQGAGGSPLPPWAAAWEEPGDITRQVDLLQDSENAWRHHQTAPVRGQRSGEGQQCWKVYLRERRSCCSHRQGLLLVVLQRLRPTVLGQFLRRFKYLPCTDPLWEEQTITDQPQWPRCGRNYFIFVHQACILPLPGDKVSTSKIPPSLSSSS